MPIYHTAFYNKSNQTHAWGWGGGRWRTKVNLYVTSLLLLANCCVQLCPADIYWTTRPFITKRVGLCIHFTVIIFKWYRLFCFCAKKKCEFYVRFVFFSFSSGFMQEFWLFCNLHVVMYEWLPTTEIDLVFRTALNVKSLHWIWKRMVIFSSETCRHCKYSV